MTCQLCGHGWASHIFPDGCTTANCLCGISSPEQEPKTELYCVQWDHWHVYPVPVFICMPRVPSSEKAS